MATVLHFATAQRFHPSSADIVSKRLGRRTHDVRWSFHRAKMHPCQVFSDHSECEELGAGKDGNNRGEKRKSRHTSLKTITDENIEENDYSKQHASKSDQARKLQRRRAKAGHHIERKAHQ